MWPSPATTRQINYGLPPEFFVVAPASSFHHNNTQHHNHHPETATAATINFDPHALNASSASAAIGVGVIPLLTATPCLASASMGSSDEDLLRNRVGTGMQLWQNQQLQSNPPYSKKPIIQDHDILLQSGGGASSSGGIGGSSSGGTTCQDCGNQAKKDCTRRRCRTCCRSRGYDCATHLKSTWVPAARRRERQHLMAATAVTAGSSQSTSGAKKPRLGTSLTTTTASHTSTSNNTPPRSFDTSSSHQGASFKEQFPGQIRAPAVFKCVKVTAVEGGDDEYAYQAVVKIGGHIFKGFLYDQGLEPRGGFPNISDLHLGGGASGGDGRNGASSSSPVLDTPDVYVPTGGGLFGGSNYGIPIN